MEARPLRFSLCKDHISHHRAWDIHVHRSPEYAGKVFRTRNRRAWLTSGILPGINAYMARDGECTGDYIRLQGSFSQNREAQNREAAYLDDEGNKVLAPC